MNNLLENNISDVTKNHYKYLLNLPNVNGIGLGFKYINNINTLEPCIHVLVEDKINSKYLSQNSLIPRSYMGIKTDVLKIGHILKKEKVKLFNNDLKILSTQENLINKLSFNNFANTKKYRPLKGGCLIGCRDAIGTLGCIVTKTVNNQKEYYILSNNHVLADDNKMPIGTDVLQPAFGFGGLPFFSSIARLDTFIPVLFTTRKNQPTNYVDCAIAKIKNGNLVSNKITGIGPITGITKAYPKLFVQKYGCVTGLTKGFITSLHATIVTGDKSDIIYKEQLNIKMKGGEGDSGSIIVDQLNRVVGLLMAGTSDGFIIANDINRVVNDLNVEIYTGE